MRDQDEGIVMSKAMSDAKTSNAGDEPGITMRRHTVTTALRLAEQAADEMNALLRAAEQERDNAARRLGDAQRKVDTLSGEREYRSRHVRDLLAAVS